MSARICAIRFAQRVSSDYHLKRLAKNEVSKYIEFRLSAVGSRVNLFTDEACALVTEASLGIPRVINVLCDMALVYGFSTGSDMITGDLVSEVIQDKQNFGIFPINGQMLK